MRLVPVDAREEEYRISKLTTDQPDPLDILGSTRRVIEQAQDVHIDQAAVERVAGDLLVRDLQPPAWDRELHWTGTPEETANFVLVLDALNFCFWSAGGEPRWRVTYQGSPINGYVALAASLTSAMRRGVPLTDAGYLSTISLDDVANLFRRPEPSEGAIPLLDYRRQHLQEVGRVLSSRYDGQFARLIAGCGQSAIQLVRQVAAGFPSFRDTAIYDGRPVYFYKRAQILAADLAGAFDHQGLGEFRDLDQLTAFADYKVPQVLHELGILIYSSELIQSLREHVELPAGSRREVEIRAGTIWAVEALRQELQRGDRMIPAQQIDWLLWDAGQRLGAGALPYHRTRTPFY